MRAREIVSAIVAGDVTGLGSAFDEYAPDLYAYCHSRLVEPADAVGAVQDVFIVASAKVSQLGQPDRLRTWLFAVARNECHRRLQAADRSAPLYEAGSEMTDELPVGTDSPAADPPALVSAALAGLSPTEHEVCELNLRHDLYGADLGDVLGMPREQAQALAARARARFATSLGVLVAAGPGQESCPDLAATLHGRGATPTGLRRVRARRHIERCEVCRDRMRRDLSPAVMLGLLPVPELPAGLRHQILRVAADVSPDAVAGRDEVTRRAEPFGTSGFPVQLTAPSATRWQPAHAIAAATAIVAVGVLGGGMFYVDYASAHAGPPAASGAGGGPAGRAFGLAGPVSAASSVPSAHGSSPRGASVPAFIPVANGSIVPSPLRARSATTPSGRSTSPSGSTSPSHSGSPTHVSPSPTHASPSPTHASPSPTHASPTPTHASPTPTLTPTHAPQTPTPPVPVPTTPPTMSTPGTTPATSPATTTLPPSTPSPATSVSIGLLGLKLSL